MNDYPEKGEIWHWIPKDSSQEHRTEQEKPCGCATVTKIQPTGGVVIVHNSWDGRELIEPDARKSGALNGESQIPNR